MLFRSMTKLLATAKKEWLLLLRDKIGLLILFGLPMCLVLFISLTQPNGDTKQKLKVLVYNRDGGKVAKSIIKGLKKVDEFKIMRVGRRYQYTFKEAKDAVAEGEYQALVVIPSKTTSRLNTYVSRLSQRRKTRGLSSRNILVYLDPAMPTALSDSVKLAIKLILERVQLETMTQLAAKVLRAPKPKEGHQVFKVRARYAGLGNENAKPNAVQQNVPAWSLFGMFFIVIPLAGTMVRERSQGVMQRLRVAPVSHFNLIMGKTVAFVCLNLIQLFLMLLVGVYILPLFGLPKLNLFEHLGLVTLTGFFAALAATGFGLLIGTWARTYQQATVMGPFVVVIFAAIGGIFVPTYLIPKALQAISQASPLHWAQSAFIDIFVRDASFQQLVPNLLKLLAFYIVTVVLSLPPFTHYVESRRVTS